MELKQKLIEKKHWNASVEKYMEAYITRPYSRGPFWGFMYQYILKEIINFMPFSIEDKLFVNICCGSGMEAEYYSKVGKSHFLCFDISEQIIKAALIRKKRNGLDYDLVISDGENLPLKDKSVHVGFVLSGLHHLPNPHKGICELKRVSKIGMIAFEPLDTIITRFLIYIKLLEKHEASGIIPYRFNKNEIINMIKMKYTPYIKFRRYFFYIPNILNKFKESLLILTIFKKLIIFMNKFMYVFGNRFIILFYVNEHSLH